MQIVEGKKVERNALTVAHFQSWIDWSRKHGLGLDFNPTFFSHPLANEGWTLSSRDSGVSASSGSNTALPAGKSERKWAANSVRRR